MPEEPPGGLCLHFSIDPYRSSTEALEKIYEASIRRSVDPDLVYGSEEVLAFVGSLVEGSLDDVTYKLSGNNSAPKVRCS